MCKLCKRLICPMNCPNYKGESALERACYCVLCGSVPRHGEVFYEMHGFPYCASCLRETNGETFIRICEKNEREWFEQIGFAARALGEER